MIESKAECQMTAEDAAVEDGVEEATAEATGMDHHPSLANAG